MALPAGLSTFTLQGGPYADPTGAVKFAGMVGKLSLTSPLRYNGGEVDGTVTVTVANDGTFTAGPLVNTSDPAVAAQGVAYRMEWNVGRFDDCPGGSRSLVFTVMASSTTVDYDTLVPSVSSPVIVVPQAVGPPGPPGAIGPAGPAGATGPAGPTGVSGTIIDNGDGTGNITLGSSVQTTNIDTTALHATANLSDLANSATARSNLGLGTAATSPASAFDAAGAAASAQAFAIQRANHTGAQSADTLTDGTTNKAYTATERTKLTAVALNNYTATTDPTISSDNTGGYGIGSVWINTTTKVMYVCLSASSGAAVWQRQTADVQTFTASGTWTKPSWATTTRLTLIGAGGGGGAGALTASGTSASGGGGGGGGAFAFREVPTSTLGATETVTIGLPGAGGAAQATASTAGIAGTAAAASTFGSHLRVGGSTYGAGGGGQIGANSTAGTAGSSMIPGATGGAGIGSAAGGGGAQSAGAASGGGAGGGISSTPAQFAGGSGNTSGAGGVGAGSAGAVGGGAGGSATSLTAGEPVGGSSGGGGGSNITGNGGNGGNGGNYGGGGGGGGAALNGSTSGAGGNGGPGICVAISL